MLSLPFSAYHYKKNIYYNFDGNFTIFTAWILNGMFNPLVPRVLYIGRSAKILISIMQEILKKKTMSVATV